MEQPCGGPSRSRASTYADPTQETVHKNGLGRGAHRESSPQGPKNGFVLCCFSRSTNEATAHHSSELWAPPFMTHIVGCGRWVGGHPRGLRVRTVVCFEGGYKTEETFCGVWVLSSFCLAFFGFSFFVSCVGRKVTFCLFLLISRTHLSCAQPRQCLD